MTAEQEEAVALIDGKRQLFRGVALNTNLCMSNPKVRTQMATYIADYAQAATNVDYLHVWLADGSRNHCECEQCQKMRPSDFYLMIMNELDDILTERGLDTRVVFICYVDTLFAPEKITINNPKRFSLLYAPIQRSYCSSVDETMPIPEAQPYQRNKWPAPKSAMAHLALLRKWQEVWPGPTFCYEYHFWKHQYFDPSGLYISRRIYEDIKSLKYMGLDGFVEDGSQRSFFPNGLAIYVFAETLVNRDVDFDELVEDYFSHAYGKDWKQALAYLQDVEKAFDFAYMSGEAGEDRLRDRFYAPSQKPKLESAKEVAVQGRKLAEDHRINPTRPQTISWRLLYHHAEYIENLGPIVAQVAIGNKTEAQEMAKKFYASFGVHEYEIERYLDFCLAMRYLEFKVLKDYPMPLQEGN